MHEATPLLRFESKFEPVTESGCWIWTACIDERKGSGYGRFVIEYKKVIYAHRAAWLLYRGEIPNGFHVCHKCDNPLCVNPDHLFIGTHQDNMADKRIKGRGRNDPPQGEASHLSKLTESQVVAIFNDNRVQRKIAAEYGVTQAQIHCIKSGKSWKHLNLT